jgi:ATP-binding protein involved in chromosome partitioning
MIREETDAGRPPVISHPDGPQAQGYLAIADAVIAKLGDASGQKKPFPKIVFEN